MSVLFRCRVNPKQLKRANKIAADLGTSLPETFRMFIAQIARTGSVPLSLSTERSLINKESRNKLLNSLDDTESW
jgi:antitoxin component of RelBE/YafQ-DinJ toxin-antitoxin module